MSILKELIARLEAQAVTIADLRAQVAAAAAATAPVPAPDATNDAAFRAAMAEALARIRLTLDGDAHLPGKLANIAAVLDTVAAAGWFAAQTDTPE